ncbi:DUF3768 domain-containing protein [Brucella gallinifaecis]|uniref:DUF3768 domain-containing protein n=1 Tax=Brucella gallinifaecis TaxID=215590 RepID=UPI00235F0578|nr:DUF3768 domain-containing protein [Brucella gallinifaecis]
MPESRKTAIIRELNDKLRQNDAGGQVVVSGALAHEDSDLIQRVRDAVRNAEIATGDGNDPYSEHDFGSVDVDGERYFWKIDYYNKEMDAGSEDPSDARQTVRLLTIMCASDY